MTTEQALIDLMEIKVDVRQVNIGKHVVNYLVTGEGPAILLLHGGNFGWGVWYRNIPKLSRHYKVFALDLPGAGRSSRLDYSSLDPMQDLLETAASFVDQVMPKPFHVFGSSVGGWLAMRLALLYPKDIEKIVLQNSVGFSDHVSLFDRVMGRYGVAKLLCDTVLRAEKRNKRVESFMRSIFADFSLSLAPEFLNYFHETMSESHNLLFISRLTALRELFLLRDDLDKILNPTLIIWGEKDKIMPLEKNREYFGRFLQVRVVIFPNSGHIPAIEEADKFNERVLNFL